MYKRLVRPLLFLFEPEFVHHFVSLVLRIFLFPRFARIIIRAFYSVNDPMLNRKLFGLDFKNPVGLAAGFDKHASMIDAMACFGFSFVEIGTVTPVNQPGNPRPRLFRLPDDKALINRMGLNNPGIEKVVRNLRRSERKVIIGGNIGKNNLTPDAHAIEDYVLVFKGLYPYVDYIAVNVSCPNVGNISKLQEKDFLLSLFAELKKIDLDMGGKKPIFVKISPEFSSGQIDDFMDLVRITGITGIIATNTTKERNGLVTPHGLVERIGMGGLSGRPLRDRSTELIRYIHEKSGGQIPVIGVGGIMNPEDAIEKLKAGASLLQLYTGFIYEGPGIVRRINKAILRHSD